MCSVEHIEHEIEESEAVSAKVLDYKRRIEVFLNSTSMSSAGPPASVATFDMMPATKTRLPKLALQKFKENVTCWMSFWDSFKAAVHDNPAISKIDKFNYPSSLLEGSTSKVVQGLTLTEGNYDSAVALLKERFGNKQVIIRISPHG